MCPGLGGPQKLWQMPSWMASWSKLQFPPSTVGGLLKPGGDPHHIPTSCLPPWPWGRPLLAPFWVGAKRTESRKRGHLSKPPATTTPWVRARPRGAVQPSPFALPCPMRNVSSQAHQLDGQLRFTEGAVSCHPSPLKPPLSGHGD